MSLNINPEAKYSVHYMNIQTFFSGFNFFNGFKIICFTTLLELYHHKDKISAISCFSAPLTNNKNSWRHNDIFQYWYKSLQNQNHGAADRT